jgi:hypothetical protein
MRNTRFREAGPGDLNLTKEKEIQSDIVFDMFSEVPSGYGEGASNKLFLQEVNREAKIVHQEPMFTPALWLGPLDMITPPPWQLQPVMDDDEVVAFMERKRRKLDSLGTMVTRNGEKSSNVLGDDLGYPYEVSSSGLRRSRWRVPAYHRQRSGVAARQASYGACVES